MSTKTNRYALHGLALSLAVILVAMIAIVFAQGSFNVTDFSGGMNLSKNLSQVGPTEARGCYNLSLSEKGCLELRPGYHSVTDSLASYDKIWSLFGHQFSNGSRYLFQVDERADSGWGDLIVSDEDGIAGHDSLASYLFPARGNWLAWLGNVYYFSDLDRPVVISRGPEDFWADNLVPSAPGQPEPHPIPGAGSLNGTYIYGFVAQVPCDADYTWSYASSTLSAEVEVDSGRVLLRNFSAQYDVLCDPTPPATINIMIVRTRANQNDFNTDSLFIIDTLDDVTNSFSAMQALIYIDTLPDTNLVPATHFWETIKNSGGVLAGSPPGNASTHDHNYSLGRMSYLAETVGDDEVLSAEDSLAAVFDRSRGDTSASYFFVFLDTLTGRYSDSCKRVMYYPMPADSLILTIVLNVPDFYPSKYCRVVYRQINDGEFYCLDTMGGGDMYTDTLNEAYYLTKNEVYDRNVPDVRFRGAIIHESRMFTWDDHAVYYSKTDTAQWPVFNMISFEQNEGEEVMGLASREGYVIAYLTNSIYIIYTTDGFVTHRSKRSPGIGMVSSASLQGYNGEGVFLGERGVSLEVGNLYLDNSLVRKSLSDNIKQALLRSPDSMANAASGIFEDQYLLSYPGTDSTFALYFGSGGWSVWSFDFLAATDYDSSGILFIKDDDERIFRLTKLDSTDNGASYTANYEKLFAGEGSQKISPSMLGLWMSTFETDSIPDTIGVSITDEKGRAVCSGRILSEDTSAAYQYINLAPISNRSGRILDLKLTFPNRRFSISGLSLEVSPAGISKGGN